MSDIRIPGTPGNCHWCGGLLKWYKVLNANYHNRCLELKVGMEKLC